MGKGLRNLQQQQLLLISLGSGEQLRDPEEAAAAEGYWGCLQEYGRTRIEINCKVKSTFNSKLFALNVVVRIPVPKYTAKANMQVITCGDGAFSRFSARPSRDGRGCNALSGSSCLDMNCTVLPRCFLLPQMTAGKAKYDSAKNELVWKIKRFEGQKEQSLAAEVELVSTTNDRSTWSRPPIKMDFQVRLRPLPELLVPLGSAFPRSRACLKGRCC